MKLLLATHTDAGVRKLSNEDSAVLLEAQTPGGIMMLAAVADGIGGLSNGELASSDVIRAFASWFEQDAEELLSVSDDLAAPHSTPLTDIKNSWDTLIQKRNQKILAFGVKKGINLGTTLTALFISPDGTYLIGHIGDSRVYHFNGRARMLTQDHTVAAMAARDRLADPDELSNMKGHSVLTQCIGATAKPEPDYLEGKAQTGDVFLLCTDGFSNRLKLEELYEVFNHEGLVDEPTMKQKLIAMTESCKQRGENDNITAVVVKVVES